MDNNNLICCRIAACREVMDDGKQWSFYLINDSDFPLDSAVLDEVTYEWGDYGSSETADVRVTDLASGAHTLIWRDDGGGAELRMEFLLLAQMCSRQARLRFEFPKLYLKNNLPVVDELDKPGWQVVAEG